MVSRISRKQSYILGMILCLCVSYKTYAKSTFESVYIGEVKKSASELAYRQARYPLYEVSAEVFIPLETIQMIKTTLASDESIDSKNTAPLLEGSAYMAPEAIYCGNIRSYALMVQEKRLLPIEALQEMGKLKCDEATFWLEEDLQGTSKLFNISDEGIQNKTEHLLKVEASHLFWEDRTFKTIAETLLLEPGETKAWQKVGKQKGIYISSMIETVNEWPVNEGVTRRYGQQNEVIFNQYSDALYLRQLSHVFPRCKMEGKMLQTIGPLKINEIVEIWRIEKHYDMHVIDGKGNKYQVPYSSVKILGESGAPYGKVSKEQIEAFANLNHMQSQTDYLLWTDLYRQRTYVLKKENGTWVLVQSFVCSSGKVNNPTPSGIFEVKYKIPYIGVQKGYRCKYALVFFRDYMYHSILFDCTGKYIQSGQYELGSKASHGCIRLSEKDSKWLHDRIPIGTTVWIR